MAEQTPPKEKLVGDLETLVTLLEEGKDPTLDMFADELPPTQPEATFNEVAKSAVEQDDTAHLQNSASVEPVAEPSTANAAERLAAPHNQDLFDALLGDGWEAESNDLLQAASATIQAQQLDWNPEDTQALTDALRVRLEQSINGWLSTTLAEQVARLRQQLLLDLQDELTQRVQSTLQSNQQQRQTKEDGLSQLAEDPAATSGTNR